MQPGILSSVSEYRHFPCGSVDWNDCNPDTVCLSCQSLPLRKCGLKSSDNQIWLLELWSLPLRKCGLKSFVSTYAITAHAVTSLAEVWIEIHSRFGCTIMYSVTSLAEVWIEISLAFFIYAPRFCHFPCGSVDWNFKSSISHGLSSVTSLAEVWIEIGEDWTSYKNGSVTSLAEVWIEIQYWSGTQYIKRVTSLAEVWIEISKVVTDNEDEAVTSLAEVWIEIPQNEPF